MHCTLLIPGLLPAEGRLAEEAVRCVTGLRLPALERLLARGRPDKAQDGEPGQPMEAWLYAACGGEADAELPAGALSRLAGRAESGTSGTSGERGHGEDSEDGKDATWMRADPVHLRLNRDQLILIPPSLFELPQDDAGRLVQTLNRHFAGQLSFHALQAQGWCVRVEPALAEAARGLRTLPLAAVAGRDVNAHLPTGPAAMRWHSLLNELQMLLHAQAVNDEREARGEPAVNSVWLWGAGSARLPALSAPWHSLSADNLLAQGLARACAIRHRDLSADAGDWLDRMPEEGRHLVVLDGLRMPLALGDLEAWRTRLESLEQYWLAPLLAALQSGRIGMLSLVVPDGATIRSLETTRGDLRRFWRRVKPFAACAADAIGTHDDARATQAG
jgi:hypothetical protein